jgi:uncharacterized lipoprotein YmbA
MSKTRYWKGWLWIGVLLLALGSAACTKPALHVQYHNLTPLAIEPSTGTETLSTILVGPIRVSSFLGQGPMIQQTSAHSSILLEQHHWAGNLEEMLSQLIIQNLSLDLQHEKIYSYPDTYNEDGIRLEVNFFHFEKDTAGDALLEVRWKIINNSDQSILKSATSEQRVKPERSGYDALPESLSLGLARLCREIANTVIELQNNGNNHD